MLNKLKLGYEMTIWIAIFWNCVFFALEVETSPILHISFTKYHNSQLNQFPPLLSFPSIFYNAETYLSEYVTSLF